MPPTRGYQQEMLDESLRRNIIKALDTGSGKTLIAVLRMKHEMERQTTKVRIDCLSSSKQKFSFCAAVMVLRPDCRSLPTTDGCNQGIPSRLRRHHFGCQRARSVERRCVMAARAQYPPYHGQVFLDALRHGYISLGRDISLLTFDEANHAIDNHPYNRIMSEFYSDLPLELRPMVLGLMTSPIHGGNIEKAFKCVLVPPMI